jgi:hypothetical protein
MQESYYSKIVERYMAFCAESGGGSELERQFASLSIQAGTVAEDEAPSKQPTTTASPATIAPTNPQTTEKTLSTLLLAMRKLREGIVASSRNDDFSTRAYIFSIRAAILMKHMESYHPALLHLLHIIHPSHPLSATEAHEFTGYLLLDLSCRQQDLAQAFAVRNHYKYSDRRIDAVLRALTHDNYHLFWRVRADVDGYQGALMGFAEEEMRMLALKCLGRAYLGVEKDFLVQVVRVEWEVLRKRYGVGWEMKEDGKVVIRKPKAP